MATDAVSKELENLNRTLKEISSNLREQNRLLKDQNILLKGMPQQDEPIMVPPLVMSGPKTYGWSMAAFFQREGELNIGDMKIEKDDSRWMWTGDIWERVELPSGQI